MNQKQLLLKALHFAEANIEDMLGTFYDTEKATQRLAAFYEAIERDGYIDLTDNVVINPVPNCAYHPGVASAFVVMESDGETPYIHLCPTCKEAFEEGQEVHDLVIEEVY